MLRLRANNYPATTNSGSLFNLMDDFFNDSFFAPTLSSANTTFKIDVKDTESAYVVEAALPGVAKESVELEYKNDRLYISVAKKETKEEDKDGYIYRESRNEAMNRAIYLKNVDSESITAKLENGILVVHAPKVLEEKNQYKIEIQ